MFCPYCGNQISNDAAFCMNCGKQVKSAQSQAPAQQPPATEPAYQAPEQQQVPVQPNIQPNFAPQAAAAVPPVNVSLNKPSHHLFIWIPLITILVSAIIFAGMYFFKSDEQKIRDRLDAFAEACNDGDIEEMMNCFDKKTRKYYETSMGLVEGLFGGITGFDIPIGDMAELFGMQELGGQMEISFTIESITIDGNTAIVKATMSDSGNSETDEITMCKEDDDWYIDLEGTTGQSLQLF